MMVAPSSKGACKSFDLSSILLEGSTVSDDLQIYWSLQGDCPMNSPHATSKWEIIRIRIEYIY
jgi:hypothetical protein